MTTTAARTSDGGFADPRPPLSTRPDRDRGWLGALLLRLHFYAGIFVGPFILVAATTGALYALTPQIEQIVYSDELRTTSSGDALPLAHQIGAADAYSGAGKHLVAVRPAPEADATTRVMYHDPTLGEGERRAIFVDPVTAEIRGDLTVYGTSGALPQRAWLDHLHRSLHLGEPGRLYSELAASWLGVVALAGLGLWVARARRTRAKKARTRTSTGRPARGYLRTRNLHATTGIWVLVLALFLSATGITWSTYGGANVSNLRTTLGVGTPTLSTSLSGADVGGGEHDGHGDAMAHDGPVVNRGAFDSVLATAQGVNIDTGLVEIRAPSEPGSAWVVEEVRRSYPTQVDSVAVDEYTLEVVDRVDFADFGLVAKLSRWGIDLHMGAMFGLANQLVMFAAASAIALLVVWGYAMWWQRRPTRGPGRVGPAPARGVLRGAPWWGTALALLVAAVIGVFLPLMGVTLVGFLAVDALVGWRAGSARGGVSARPEHRSARGAR